MVGQRLIDLILTVMTILSTVLIAKEWVDVRTQNMPTKCRQILMVVVVAIQSSVAVYASDPPIKTRSPDDRMLQQSGKVNREVRAPIDFSGQTENTKGESNLDVSESPLSGPRGKETPSGTRQGRYCENDFRRSGFPFCIGRFAAPSTDSFHQVGYVGGGTLFGGTGRRSNEGTFGMDYSGFLFSRKTWLKWSHGGRSQGGAGRYETEGPRLLPE